MNPLEGLTSNQQKRLNERLKVGSTVAEVSEVLGCPSLGAARRILNNLFNAGSVTRSAGVPQGRGRPPMIYRSID